MKTTAELQARKEVLMESERKAVSILNCCVPASEAIDLIDEILRLRNFQTEQWKWVKQTFPDESPGDVFDHLAEEIEELAENIYDAEEMADCFLLLQCLASHAGVDLLAAAREKFEKCKGRTWKKTERGFRHS